MTTMLETTEESETAELPAPTMAVLLGGGPDRLRTPCQGVDPEWFFAEVPDVIEDAKRVCQPCPARLGCLRGALMRREPHGVWGGELFQNGVVVERKRPRGRPRKVRPSSDEGLPLAA